MRRLLSKNSLWSAMVLFFVTAFLAGSQGTTLAAGNRLDGTAATPVTIERQGPQTGQFKANELTVNFRQVISGNSMQLSGTVRFGIPIVANYSTVRTFELGVILADAQGNVLQRQMLTTAYNTDVNDLVKFTQTVPITAQATAMVFSYSGQAYGPGSTPTNFWLEPVTK